MKNGYIIAGFTIILIGAGFFFISREVIHPQREAAVLLSKGKLLLERNDDSSLRRAVDELTTLAARYPDTKEAKEAIYYLANGYEKLGMGDIALTKYRKLLEYPLSEKLREKVKFKIAKLQIMKSYTEEGMASFMNLLAKTEDPGMRSEIYSEIAGYNARRGRQKEAVRNYQIALRENPANREARLGLARVLSALGKDYEAFGIYESYLAGDDSTTESSGDEKEQKDDSSEKPLYTEKNALTEGVQLFKQHKYHKAIKKLRTVVENSKGSEAEDEALYYMGYSFFKLNDYTNAVKYFNEAISNVPRNRDQHSYIKKGESYYHRKNFKKAAKVFSRYREIYPNGDYYKIAGDWEQECLRIIRDQSGLTIDDDIEEPTDRQEDDKKTETDKKDDVKLIESDQIIEPSIESDKVVP